MAARGWRTQNQPMKTNLTPSIRAKTITWITYVSAGVIALHCAEANPRSSASYNILTDVLDYGGVTESSAN